MSDNTLVLGIGNTLLADEGTGIHMLDYMRRHHPELTAIDYLDGGTLSFTLAPYIEEADSLIVIDAAELQAQPGTVQVFADEAMDTFAGKTKRSVHEVSLGDLLAIAHLTDSMPLNRALIAIQPQDIDWGHSLSNPVKQALPVVARHIIDLIRNWSPGRADPGVSRGLSRQPEPLGVEG